MQRTRSAVSAVLSNVGALQAIVAGAVLAVALGIGFVTLGREQLRLAGTNSVRPDTYVVQLPHGSQACETNVPLLKGSAGIQALVATFGRPGSKLTLTGEISSPRTKLHSTASRYLDGTWVTFPIEPVRQSTTLERVCITAGGRKVALAGEPYPKGAGASALALDGQEVGADIAIRTVRAHKESLASLAPTIFHRASLFRPGWVGEWTYWVLAALIAAGLVGSFLLIRAWRSGVTGRLAIVAVAAVAFLNGTAWSLVMPAFAPPDEVAHYAYVESLVEVGRRPNRDLTGSGGAFSNGMLAAVDVAGLGVVKGPLGKPPWNAAEERNLDDRIHQLGKAARKGGGGFTTAAGYSPLYYGLETVPYVAARSSSFLTRLWLMRVFSALIAAATAAFAFLLGRELVPSVPWFAPTVGLGVAFQPMFAFVGGAVNNDNLLFCVSALELYLLARVLRRGLDPRLGAAVGGVLALAIVAKPTALAFAPAVATCLGWSILRSTDRRATAQAAGIALGAFLAVSALGWILFSAYDTTGDVLDTGTAGTAKPFRIRELLSYTWQWYLPPLPFMSDFFPAQKPVFDVFFKGFWGNFGHVDTFFPNRVYVWLLLACVACLVLAGVGLWRERASFARPLASVVIALILVASLGLLVNFVSYRALLTGAYFAQGRYLLPAVPLVGAAIATAGLAFGRERGAAAATGMVTALACFNAFCLGLVLFRFYT